VTAHAEARLTCRLCARPGSGTDLLAWSTAREPDGRATALCPSCARQHVRDIEARLDP
jgi:hypothetical protein